MVRSVVDRHSTTSEQRRAQGGRYGTRRAAATLRQSAQLRARRRGAIISVLPAPCRWLPTGRRAARAVFTTAAADRLRLFIGRGAAAALRTRNADLCASGAEPSPSASGWSYSYKDFVSSLRSSSVPSACRTAYVIAPPQRSCVRDQRRGPCGVTIAASWGARSSPASRAARPLRTTLPRRARRPRQPAAARRCIARESRAFEVSTS